MTKLGCRKIGLLSAETAGALTLVVAAVTSAAGPDWAGTTEHLQELMDATVFVKVERVFRNQTIPTSGSGFFVSADGLLLTNWHVVAPQVELELFGTHTEVSTSIGDIEVVAYSGTKEESTVIGRVLALDRVRDLAILKVPLRPKAFLTFASEPRVAVMLPIVAVGYPFGELVSGSRKNPEVSVTMGHITAIRHTGDQPDLVQIDAAVNPGNSGGPLVNQDKQVIGVICSGISGGNSTSFAVAPEKLQAFVAENQVRVTLDPDRIWNRSDPIRATVASLLLNLDSLRCRYRLEGNDIDPSQGELPCSQTGCAGSISIPPALPGRPPSQDYSLALSLVRETGDTVLKRNFRLGTQVSGEQRVRSDREPAAMMRDRNLIGNRTESGDPAVYLGPEPTPPARATNRTALSDLASRIKLRREPGDKTLLVDNQGLVRCRREMPQDNYTKLTDTGARELAHRLDIAECEFSQLASDIQAALDKASPQRSWNGSVRCTYEPNATQCDYYYATVLRSPPSKRGRLQALYDEITNLVGVLADHRLCRCQSGEWFERTHEIPPCRDCRLPKMEPPGVLSGY